MILLRRKEHKMKLLSVECMKKKNRKSQIKWGLILSKSSVTNVR